MSELSDTMKAENRLLKTELRDIQRSKEVTLYEMDHLGKEEEILRLKKIVMEYRRKENKSSASYNKKTDDPDFNEKCLQHDHRGGKNILIEEPCGKLPNDPNTARSQEDLADFHVCASKVFLSWAHIST